MLESRNEVDNALDVITIEDVVNVMKDKCRLKLLVSYALLNKEYNEVARF